MHQPQVFVFFFGGGSRDQGVAAEVGPTPFPLPEVRVNNFLARLSVSKRARPQDTSLFCENTLRVCLKSETPNTWLSLWFTSRRKPKKLHTSCVPLFAG